jgi:hypothetical protein
MAFPASTQTLSDALESARGTANRIKTATQSLRDNSAAGSVARTEFVNLQRFLQKAIDAWNASAAVPGIAAYAQAQYDDVGLDIAAEFTTMVAAAVTLRDWIFTNIPTDSGSGAALLNIVGSDGELTPIDVTTAQSAGFRTEADVFILTIG